MRVRSVRRAAVVLGVLFVVSAALFAWIVGPAGTGAVASPPSPHAAPAPPPIASEEAVLFQRHCGSCHTTHELEPHFLRMNPDHRREIDAFLERHGTASAAEDALIIEYLVP